MLDIPVKHMGDVNDGEHIVGLYTDSLFEIPNLDTMVTFNYVIENIGDADYSAIEDGLKAAVAAGLTALEVPGGSTIAEIGSKIVHLFAANCDGPVAVDQISASGHLLDKWTTDNRVHSETRHYTYGSQTFCGASPEYDVTWSVVRL
ncbi:MAG: hypothetical protein H6644_09895 [Caldilineaceae bacterium]|nr:hypothetical protein [Caldilineaceae bacterium]